MDEAGPSGEESTDASTLPPDDNSDAQAAKNPGEGAVGLVHNEQQAPGVSAAAAPSNVTMSSKLRHTWSDPGVMELEPGCGVFVATLSVRNIEQLSKTATATARCLLTAVFMEQALLTCSGKGNRAKGTHRPNEQRPPLEPAAVRAILSYTKTTAAKKGWEFSEKIILQSLGTKLSEMRSKKAKQLSVQETAA
ncbi:uncharacterized protein LOC144103275 [Amblyomma americanum]